MDKQEVKEIIEMTIKELKKEHMLKETMDAIYVDVSERLTKYYRNGETDLKIKLALEEFKDDLYIEILYLYYRDNMTIERIAEELGVDISTVTRNKKRLCISLYNLLE